jgi:hypothetical protein
MSKKQDQNTSENSARRRVFLRVCDEIDQKQREKSRKRRNRRKEDTE